MRAVGHDALPRIDQRGLQSARRKRFADNPAGKQFTISCDVIGGPRSQFAHRGNAAQQFVERVELAFQFAVKARENAGSQQFSRGVVMAFAQSARKPQGRFSITSPGRQRHLEKRVGDLGHGAHHDHRLFLRSPFDDGSSAIDRLGVLDRGPAKFHHDHRGQSRLRRQPSAGSNVSMALSHGDVGTPLFDDMRERSTLLQPA